MPTYDYVCSACGHALEIFHSMTEPAKKKCPACGKSKLERKIGAGAGFLFKGEGFYKTDYRSDSYKQGEAAEKATPPAASASSAPETEKKGEAKPKEAQTPPAQKADSKSKPRVESSPKSHSKSKDRT